MGAAAVCLSLNANAGETGTPDEAKDMVKVASDPGNGWVDYRWPYPGSDEIKQKTSYVIKNDKGLFCGVGANK